MASKFLIFLVVFSLKCTSPGQSEQTMTCGGEDLEINCTNNTIIKITTAKLGYENSHDARKCTDERPSSSCHSTKGQKIVEERCVNKTECRIAVNRHTFRDWPCGNYGEAVYLNVMYSCESVDPPTFAPTKRYTPAPSSAAGTPSVSAAAAGGDQVCHACSGPECVRCKRCRKRDISWPETPAGEWATAPCPNNENLMEARLQCSTDPVQWIGRPDLSKCVSSKVHNINQQLRNNLSTSSLGSVATNLVAVTEDEFLAGGDLVGVSNAMYDVVDLLAAAPVDPSHGGTVEHYIRHVSSSVVTATNNLLDTKRSASWGDLPQSRWGSVAARMMTTVESSAFQVANALSSPQKIVNVTDNIVLEVNVVDAAGEVKDAQFPNADALQGSSWENTQNSILLPAESLKTFAKKGHAKVVFTSYSNLENLLLPSSSTTGETKAQSAEERLTRSFCSLLNESNECENVINSKIISLSVNSHKRTESETTLPKPVVFTLQHQQTENVSQPICAYWKLTDNNDLNGQWMTDGCEVIHESSNETHTTCSCNHLTSFAIIMSPTAPALPPDHALALDVLTYIGCSISIICLFLSFLTFSCFRNLQCDRNTIHKNLVLCLFIANMIFLIGIDMAQFKIFCSVVAGFLHYFFLTAFAWMCIEGIQLYYMLVEVFEADKSHVLWFYLSAYGVPALVVTISAAVYHQGYGTDTYCWLTPDRGFIWAFLAPVLAIIIVNCVMLGIALRAMYRHSVSAATWRMKQKDKVGQMRSWLKGSVVLIVLLGLTWLFGFLFVSQSTIAFAYIFTILNSLQGLFIFIFHCLLNDKVQIEYKRFVRNATWLPERFRVWYGGSRTSYATNSNMHKSGSGSEGRHFSRFGFGRLRSSSQSTSISKLTSSQKRLTVKSEEENKETAAAPAVSVVVDSGIEDPSSYLESAQIHLGESEFDTQGFMSTLEGSVADTDYTDRLVKRESTTPKSAPEKSSIPVTDVITEEPQNENQKRKSRSSRNTDSVKSNRDAGAPNEIDSPNESQNSDKTQNTSSNADLFSNKNNENTKKKSSKKDQNSDTPKIVSFKSESFEKQSQTTTKSVKVYRHPDKSDKVDPAEQEPLQKSNEVNKSSSWVPKSTGV